MALINYAANKYYTGMGTPHISSNLYDVDIFDHNF